MKLFKNLFRSDANQSAGEISQLQKNYEEMMESYYSNRLASAGIAQTKIQAGTITASKISASTYTTPKTLWIGITPAENGYLVKVQNTASPVAPQSYKTHIAATFEEVQEIVAANVVAQKLDDAG